MIVGAVAVVPPPVPVVTLVLSVNVIGSEAAKADEADRFARLSVNLIAVVPADVARTLNVSSSNCFVPAANVGSSPVRSSGVVKPMMNDILPNAREDRFGEIDAPPRSAPFARAEYSRTAGSNSTEKATELTSPVVVARLIATCPVWPAATAKELFTTVAVTNRAGEASAKAEMAAVKNASAGKKKFFNII